MINLIVDRSKAFYVFGRGKGHLSRLAGMLAEKYGAKLVNTICVGEEVHWFETQDRGEGHNAGVERLVRNELGTLYSSGLMEPEKS